jgi:hypothetical protein
MKRFIVSFAAAAILSMPMAASALEKMDNSQLRSATGQAGVSIAVDDIVIYQSGLSDTTYWDTDGVYTSTQAAGIMIDQAEEMEKLITIDAILDGVKYGATALNAIFGTTNIGILDGGAGVTNPALAAAFNPVDGSTGNFLNGISPLTIDVGTCKALTAGWDYNVGVVMAARGLTDPAAVGDGAGALDVGGVVIGLPTVEIKTYSTVDFKTIKLRNGSYDSTTGIVTENTAFADVDHFNVGHAFITIEKEGVSTMAILGGRLEIAPH